MTVRARKLLPAIGAALALAPALVVSAFAQSPGGTYDPYGPYVPAPDKKAPRLTKVTLKPKAARAKVKRTLTFTLDEPARVAGIVTRRSTGVRTRGRRCVRRTRKRHGPGCMLRTRAGKVLAARANRGANMARLDLRKLEPGLYTLTLTPADPSGNVGQAKAVAFTIKA